MPLAWAEQARARARSSSVKSSLCFAWGWSMRSWNGAMQSSSTLEIKSPSAFFQNQLVGSVKRTFLGELSKGGGVQVMKTRANTEEYKGFKGLQAIDQV